MSPARFELHRAKLMAAASAAAYCASTDLIQECFSCETVARFANGPVAGFVANLGEETILAFQGTASPFEDWEFSVRQWLANLDFRQTPAHNGRVHRGFYQSLHDVWDAVNQVFGSQQHTRKTLWVTGHSLGGALAILAGIRLHEKGLPVSGVYTFGAPNVGDSAFASAYGPPVHRIENCCDLVCHVPPAGLLSSVVSKVLGRFTIPEDVQYDRLGVPIVLNESGKHWTNCSPGEQYTSAFLRLMDNLIAAGTDINTFLADHSIDAYRARLERSAVGPPSILVELPRRVLSALRCIERIGATLRDRSGRIIAFLQETGVLSQAIDRHATRSICLEAADIATSACGDQVLRSLSALQLLSGASLAASLVGIGVSVAGFALVLNRLQRVENLANESRQEALAARLAAERLEVRTVSQNKANMVALLEYAEEAWSRSDPTSAWLELQLPLLTQLNYEQCLLGKAAAKSILLDGRFTFEEAIMAYESVLLLDSVRFQTLLLLDEKAAALVYAQRFLEWHESAILKLPPDEIARARSSVPGEGKMHDEPELRAHARRRAQGFKEQVFEVHRHAGQRIDLVRYLLDRAINGRSYIEQVRQETDAPVHFLVVT